MRTEGIDLWRDVAWFRFWLMLLLDMSLTVYTIVVLHRKAQATCEAQSPWEDCGAAGWPYSAWMVAFLLAPFLSFGWFLCTSVFWAKSREARMESDLGSASLLLGDVLLWEMLACAVLGLLGGAVLLVVCAACAVALPLLAAWDYQRAQAFAVYTLVFLGLFASLPNAGYLTYLYLAPPASYDADGDLLANPVYIANTWAYLRQVVVNLLSASAFTAPV
ncbi:hypothetical protein HYH03_018503 [Edaphochlamys debaryana]|uniref:Uncharacterized protein n=1 Tax=Edaphochlamys debaryana TaxID=47281 RepID=A0A835XFS6_9CHLO|nr:hypothetical protein HYH03_018503 [Edaphochlamys debaryana]|eukprot:KAG2482579.1 hypothetical protein HYH03_018503 [Edaphochlamys debaryana]